MAASDRKLRPRTKEGTAVTAPTSSPSPTKSPIKKKSSKEHLLLFTPEKDLHEHYEFGGPLGALSIIVGSVVLLYYFWICLTFYEGHLIGPSSFSSIGPFFNDLLQLIYKVEFISSDLK